ncbi:PAS domain S-box protein [Cesiribacter sp. SM1]|uniref:PAS domain-containing sensor histidine kinase n=1 Tax=Cesiribacter sp. SM1 TaxID=2861196 RepID=UPI001CD78EAE|nr:PAS domain S-box protein [Cesiribacter sp. SM1]
MALVVQENESKSLFCFKEAKKFTNYLLNNRLEEVARENLKMLREYQLPLLAFFDHLSEEELLLVTQKSLQAFFEDIDQDTALTKALLELIHWKNNELPGIPKEGIQGVDLVIGYSIRKQLFLKFLPDFTSDCNQIVSIMQEMEQFHIELKRHAFDTYVEIQKEELRKQNDFLSSLVSNSEDAIMAFDPELRLTEWNTSAEKIFGSTREDVLGRGVTSINPKLKNTPYLNSLEKALKGERIQLVRQPYINRKGWYDAILVPLHDKEGSVSGALSVIHDVSEAVEQEERLKEHQEELQASNEELQESLAQLEETQEILRTAVEQLEEAQAIAQLGNWEYDITRNLVFWSKEMRRIYGIGEEELDLTYNTYLELIHPDDREVVATTIADCSVDQIPFAIEHRICRRDGEVRWVLSQGKASLTSDGKLYKLSGTGMDITERKLAEMKVQEEQHFIRTVTDTTPDVITVFDLEKRVNIYGNRELHEVLGYTPEEVDELRKTKGSNWVYSLLHPEDLPRFFAFIEGLRSYTGQQAREIEYRGKNKQGHYLWIMGRYNVFKRNEKGQATQIIGVSRDITERKKAEQLILESEARLREINNKLEEQVASRTSELSRKNQQLTRINADLDNFIYTASHDLKAPIANLEGLLTLLDAKIKASLSEREQNLLDMIYKSVNRFKKTIKDLTDIAHMQKELEEEVAEAVHFQPLLQDLQADISNLMQESNTQLHINLEVDKLNYNRKNMRSILHNLITNAIKYRHPDRAPEIHLGTRRIGDYIVLRVSDNGQGIPQKQQDKIFSLFKRLHKDVEGSGMGLYIVKRIIENSGGRIEVESEVGQGSVFNLYLLDQAVNES